MNDLTIEDLILMLLARPGRPRNHSDNLDLFRTLFERDVAGLSLTFNLGTGFGLAIIAAIIGTIVESVRSGMFDVALWVTVGIAVAALVLICLVAQRIHVRRVGMRRRYLDLIRLYYYLDGVT